MPPPVSSHWLVVVLKRVVWDVAGLGWVGLCCVDGVWEWIVIGGWINTNRWPCRQHGIVGLSLMPGVH